MISSRKHKGSSQQVFNHLLRSQQGLFYHGVWNVRIEGSRRQRGEMLGIQSQASSSHNQRHCLAIQSTLMRLQKKRCGCLGEGESRTHFRYRSLSSHRFSSKTLQPHLFILSVQRKTQITHVNFLRVTNGIVKQMFVWFLWVILEGFLCLG